MSSLATFPPSALLAPGIARSVFLPWIDVWGCQQWLEADTGITLSGSNVVAWQDLTGRGKAAVSAGTPPVFNATGGPLARPMVDFSGVQYLTHDCCLPAPATLVVVFKSTAAAGFAGLYMAGKTGTQGVNLFSRLNTSGHWGSYQNAEVPSGVATPATYKKCIVTTAAYNSIDFRTGGTVLDHVTSGVSAYDPNVTGLIGVGQVGSQGALSSVVLLGGWNRTLTVFESQRVEAYIAAKYGV